MSAAATRPAPLKEIALRPLVKITAAPGQYGTDREGVEWGNRMFGQVFELEAGNDVRLSLDLGARGLIPNRLLVDSSLSADVGHLVLTKRGTHYVIEPLADACLEPKRRKDQDAHSMGVIVGHWREG